MVSNISFPVAVSTTQNLLNRIDCSSKIAIVFNSYNSYCRNSDPVQTWPPISKRHTFCMFKGGVGKFTTAIQLGAYLQKHAPIRNTKKQPSAGALANLMWVRDKKEQNRYSWKYLILNISGCLKLLFEVKVRLHQHRPFFYLICLVFR